MSIQKEKIGNLTQEDIKKYCEDVFLDGKVKPERKITFWTTTEGMKEFDKAMKDYIKEENKLNNNGITE